MATFNIANGSLQSGNKSLFETNIIATPNGVVSTSNPLPVNIGTSTISITGNVNVQTATNTNIFNSNGVAITNTAPLSVYVTSNVVSSVNNFPSTQNVSFSNQSVNVVGNVAGITSTINVANGYQSVQNVNVLSNTTNYVYTQAAPTWSVDALSKIRTSTINNQDFFFPTVDDDTTFRWNQVLTGTNSNSQFLANTSEIQISSGNTASGSAIRQTYTKYKIIPGSSHTVYSTVNWNANTSETGVTRRTGLFDAYNGAFWEQTANTLAVVVRRTLANGALVEDRTYANSFNQDKLDGTGPSGFNIFSHGLNDYYTFWFDLIGGRTGRIRFGMGGPNGPQICHIAAYGGNNANTTTSINDNSLPLRREIFNTTSQTQSPTFSMSSVVYQTESPITFNPSPSSAYNINGYIPGGTLTPLLTIGLRSGAPYNGSDISPGEFSIVDMNNQGKNASPGTFFYQVIYNANVNGTYAYAGNGSVSNTNIGRSSKMWNWANTATITGGLVVLSGITQSGVGQQNLDGLPGTFNLGSDINGNPATLTIAIQQLLAGGSSANVVVNWNLLEQL